MDAVHLNKQGQIVAFLMVESNIETKILEICILYVRPEYQNKVSVPQC